MPYRFQRTSHCRRCGRERRDDEVFSSRGRCFQCSARRLAVNIVEMVHHSGPGFLEWRRRVAASVGAILIDDLEADDEREAA